MWYVVDPSNEKNIVDRMTPRQFHDAIENGKYLLKWKSLSGEGLR